MKICAIQFCRACKKETYHRNMNGRGEEPLMCCVRCGNDEKGQQHPEMVET